MMIHNRLVGMKLDTYKITSVLESVLSKCSLSKHESTEMKPIDVKKEFNKSLICWNLHNKAKEERLYFEVKQGDQCL